MPCWICFCMRASGLALRFDPLGDRKNTLTSNGWFRNLYRQAEVAPRRKIGIIGRTRMVEEVDAVRRSVLWADAPRKRELRHENSLK